LHAVPQRGQHILSALASQVPQWLEVAGFPRLEETSIGVDTAYSTAIFRRPKFYAGEPLIFVNGPAPDFTRRGYLMQNANETLLVSLIGRFGDYPPTDKDGLLLSRKSCTHQWFISSSTEPSS
jgi:hypothetical protein